MMPQGLQELFMPHDGHPRQTSSYDRDDRGGTMLGTRPSPAKRKRILLMPGETHALASLDGAGLITRLWMTTWLPGRAWALDALVLRCFWDGEDQPSVEAPISAFFGLPFGRYRQYSSLPIELTSGGFTCRFPMPFANGAHITLTNTGDHPIDPIFFAVSYLDLRELPPSDLRFHAQWRRERRTQRGQPYTVLEATGDGHFVGCTLQMQNREWWLRPPLSTMIFPNGLGMGMLEGPERIWIDGEHEPTIHGTGTEDYFNAGWYFLQGTFSAPQHGCTMRDLLLARVAAYRFDIDNPLPFTRSFRMTIDHGFENRVAADYASVAYWYQREPHAAFPALPPLAQRRPIPAWRNALQGLLLLALPLSGTSAALQALWRSLRSR